MRCPSCVARHGFSHVASFAEPEPKEIRTDMIEVQSLTKAFGPITAVNRVDFVVTKGEILGFLGPNGAGKSTTMRMITGYLPPTSGTAIIGGADILTRPIEARRKIGYLSETSPVYPDMTTTEFLDFCAEVRGFSGKARNMAVGSAIEKCFLESVRFQTVGTLSKGYRQRVCFAQSILHDPEYLILDEPTDGLDPNQKHEVRQMIREMRHDKGILISTHILDEVDAICSRAIIIAKGKIVANETPDDLRRRDPAHGAWTLRFDSEPASGIIASLQNIDGVASARLVTREDADTAELVVLPAAFDPELAGRLDAVCREAGCVPREIHSTAGRLDTVFRMLTAA